jgi:hypothetical protein
MHWTSSRSSSVSVIPKQLQAHQKTRLSSVSMLTLMTTRHLRQCDLMLDISSLEHVEVFPVDIKLDYKPRRVDYRALREGRTIELMNFFHFDGAEMTLRHITLKGVCICN